MCVKKHGDTYLPSRKQRSIETDRNSRTACVHANLNMKMNRTSTQQATTTLSTLLEDKVNMMPHKAMTLPNGTRVVEMVLPRGTKWNKFLVTINEVRI
jgi:hypothetical protein